MKWKKNIHPEYGWKDNPYEHAGGYISENGKWQLYQDGEWVKRRDDGMDNFVRRGDWIIEYNWNEVGRVETLSDAKEYVKQLGNRIEKNPSDFFEKGGEIKEALKEINKLKETHYCSVEFGDCIAAANDATDILDKYNIDYIVKEGAVYTNRIIPKDYYGKGTREHREQKEHTWIELKNGQIIDLSIDQFSDSGGIKEYLEKYLGYKGQQWTAEEYRKRKEKEIKKTKAKPYLSQTNFGYQTKLPKEIGLEKGGEIKTEIIPTTAEEGTIYFLVNGNRIGEVDFYYNGDIISDSLYELPKGYLTIEKAKEFYIKYIEVYPEYRGKRYTDKMLSITENYAKDKGATIITLRPDYGGADKPDNPYLDNIYLKNNFNYIFPNDIDEWGMYKNIYKEGGLIGQSCTYDFEGYEINAIDCKDRGVNYLLTSEYDFVAKRLYETDQSVWLYYNYINRINISWKDCNRFRNQIKLIFPKLPYEIELQKAPSSASIAGKKAKDRSYATYNLEYPAGINTKVVMVCCDKGWGARFLDKNTTLPLPSLKRNDYYSLTTLIHEIAHCLDFMYQYQSKKKVVAGHEQIFVDVLIKILKACRAGKIPAAKEFDERAYTLQNIYTNPTFANKVRVGRYSQKKTGKIWGIQMNSVIGNKIEEEIDLKIKKDTDIPDDQLNLLETTLKALDDPKDPNSFIEKLIREGKRKEALKYHKLIKKYLTETQRLKNFDILNEVQEALNMTRSDIDLGIG